jgi:hypothetical protein
VSASPRRQHRWLVALLALFALVSADGLHELFHADAAPVVARVASGHIEAHSGDCPHVPHVPPRDHHACLLCQQRTGPNTLALPGIAALVQAPRAVAAWQAVADFPGAACVSSVLGARGPPLTPA